MVDVGITGSDRPSLDSVDQALPGIGSGVGVQIPGLKEGVHPKGIEVCVCMWCLEILALMRIMRGAAAH